MGFDYSVVFFSGVLGVSSCCKIHGILVMHMRMPVKVPKYAYPVTVYLDDMQMMSMKNLIRSLTEILPLKE